MIPRTVLALDLSTVHGEISLMRGGDVLFQEGFQAERSHNAELFAPLRRALDAAESRVDLIVVGTGPGSYTGVRIAIAAAQGLALSGGAPVIGWSSIAAPGGGGSSFRVIGDARRGAHYIATVVDGRLAGAIEIWPADEARSRVEAGREHDWLTFDAKIPFDLPFVQASRPSAVRLCELAMELTEEEIRRLASAPLEPCYLQEAFITTARKPGKQVPAGG